MLLEVYIPFRVVCEQKKNWLWKETQNWTGWKFSQDCKSSHFSMWRKTWTWNPSKDSGSQALKLQQMRGSSCPDRRATCHYYLESKTRLKSSINACRYLCYLCFQKSCKASYLIIKHHLLPLLFGWHGPAVVQPRPLQSQIISSLRLEQEPFGPKDCLVFAAVLSAFSDVLSSYLLSYL